MKKIIVDIDIEGNIQIEALGFSGPACEQATKTIEEALGQKTTSVKKAEYFQSATQAHQRMEGKA